MDRKQFVEELKKQGFSLLRHGTNHDVWSNGEAKIQLSRTKVGRSYTPGHIRSAIRKLDRT